MGPIAPTCAEKQCQDQSDDHTSSFLKWEEVVILMGKRKTREVCTGPLLQISEGRGCHPFPPVNTEAFTELLGHVSPNGAKRVRRQPRIWEQIRGEQLCI